MCGIYELEHQKQLEERPVTCVYYSIFELVARLYMCKGGCNFRVRNADKAEVRLPYKLA